MSETSLLSHSSPPTKSDFQSFIITEIINKFGVITLNRPHALNALHPYMFQELKRILENWKNDPYVEAVIIKSNCDRAFSAGGDLRAVFDAKKNNDLEFLDFLFRQEYALDHLIHTYPKPYLSFIHGIVMGGGMGISINGRYRFMSETTKAAMPESKIGFFTDAGATHFLNKCPESIGLFVGLSGYISDINDALFCGFATHFVPQNDHKALFKRIIAYDFTNTNQNAKHITEHIKTCTEPYERSHHIEKYEKSYLYTHQKTIQRFFSLSSVRDIMTSLEACSQKTDDPDCEFAKTYYHCLQQRSPTSLAVIYEQLTHGKTLKTFSDIMEYEYKLSQNFIKHHDFFEGIRSVIVDKDQNPSWQPKTLADVTHDFVSSHFQKQNRPLFGAPI